MKISKIYHADHGVDPADIIAAVEKARVSIGFFNITVEGEKLHICRMYGPKCGDEIVSSTEVQFVQRTPDRPPSRIISMPARMSRKLTVIGVKDENGDLEIYTSYGGPSAEPEPGDGALKGSAEWMQRAIHFWSQHALTMSEEVSEEVV